MTQLLKFSAVSIILQVHFVALKLTETNFFSHKTRWRRTERALSVGKQTLQYYLHYFTEFEPETTVCILLGGE